MTHLSNVPYACLPPGMSFSLCPTSLVEIILFKAQVQETLFPPSFLPVVSGPFLVPSYCCTSTWARITSYCAAGFLV